jgi:4-amino-4-deoxy-L-arabinose transferase-like glycosyltransferase
MDTSDHNSRPQRVFPPGILALAGAAVLLRIGLSVVLPRTIKWDEPAYLLAGYNLLTGNGFTSSGFPELHFPPLFPTVGGLLYLLLRDFEQASNFAYALFGGLLIVPVFVIARRIYGARTAWLASILTAVFPPLTVDVLFWGTLTEPLYLFCLYGALACFLVALEDDKIRAFPIAGTFFGLAYLTRPEAVVYFLVFMVFACVWLRKALNNRRTWYALGSFVSPFLICAIPYIWYLHAYTGQWMVSGKIQFVWQQASSSNGGTMYFDLMPGGEIAWVSPERFQASTLQSVLANPGDILRRVIKNGRLLTDRFFQMGGFWWGFTPLVVVTLFTRPWDRVRLRHEGFLITILLVLVLTFLPFFYGTRFFAPAFPALLMWTAQGALYLGAWLHETAVLCYGKPLCSTYLKSVLRWLPAGMVTGLMILIIPLAAQSWMAATSYGHKEAGLWLKTHSSADAKVMTEELAVALYADRRWVPSPRTDWVSFSRYARDHGANYFVVYDFILVEQQAQLAHMLQSAPEFELVFTFEESHMPVSRKTLVYRISHSSEQENRRHHK